MLQKSKKNASFYFRVATAVLALVTLIYYSIQSNIDTCFRLPIAILLGAAIVLEIVSLFVKLDFLPMLAAAAIGVSFGLMLFYALPTFSDIWNNVNFIGGNATAYFIYLGAIFATFVLSELPCFMKSEI